VRIVTDPVTEQRLKTGNRAEKETSAKEMAEQPDGMQAHNRNEAVRQMKTKCTGRLGLPCEKLKNVC
jgi:hypothetical protein